MCYNRYELPMDDTKGAVLSAVGEQVLSPDVLQAAIERAVARLTTSHHDDQAQRLHSEQRTLQSELERLTTALAAGGNLPSVLQAIREREARHSTVKARLGALAQVAAIPKRDRATLRGELQHRAQEWRAPLTQHVAQARQLLRKVLAERLTMTPEPGEDRYAAVTGDGTLTKF